MKIFVLIIQWSVGLFLTLGSLGGFMAGDIIYAFIALIVGLVLLPPVAARFTAKKTNHPAALPVTDESSGKTPVPSPEEKRLLKIIQEGESQIAEFKSTLRVDLKTGRPEKFIQHAVIKTIAAFLNSKGGILYIGIDDAKNIIGLEADLNSFSGHDLLDEFKKFLDTMLANALGNRFQRYLQVEFPELSGKMICAIIIQQASTSPVYVLNEQKHEIFYIRRLASTIDLPPSEAIMYIREHWN